MTNQDISYIFKDKNSVAQIKEKLPKMFHIAEMESSRAGKIGMEVGSVREKIIIALLAYKFGEENLNTNIPITEPETDVILNKKEISIKTISGSLSGVKAVWTVDADRAKYFIDNYKPKCDLIIVQICWGSSNGGLFFVPLEAQKEVLGSMGKNAYLKMPKAGTNPRGVEYTKEAMEKLVSHKKTIKVEINWNKNKVDYKVYERWMDYWSNKSKLN